MVYGLIEIIWILLIVAIAGICAMMVGNREIKREEVRSLEEIAERAVRFSEDCYMEGIIPIQRAKRLAVFYLMQESKGRIGKQEAEQKIAELMEQSQKPQQKAE